MVPQINQRHHFLRILHVADFSAQVARVLDSGTDKTPHSIASAGFRAEATGVFFANDGVIRKRFVDGTNDESLGPEVGN